MRLAAVIRAVLSLTERGGELSDVEVIWRQYPKVVGYGHYGHRLLFDSEGYLWISSGDRQKFTPAQDMQANLGKVLRLNDDGSVDLSDAVLLLSYLFAGGPAPGGPERSEGRLYQ